MAQYDLVLGSGSHAKPDLSVPAQPAQSINSTIQSDSKQETVELKAPCLASRASAIQEQGFSEAVAVQIEAPQRGSTRLVYATKWSIFTKWCHSNQVDLRAPPFKSIAKFLLYLFQYRKLQPSHRWLPISHGRKTGKFAH